MFGKGKFASFFGRQPGSQVDEPARPQQEPVQLSSNFRKPLGRSPQDYPPPAKDEEIRKVLFRTAEDAIAFRHVFPPRHNTVSTTFFGGLPRVPEGFAWPRSLFEHFANVPAHNPLSFLGKIDCAELPETGLRKFLPRHGVLYFFVHWDIFEGYDDERIMRNLVHYAPGSPRQWSEAVPPADLPPCYGQNASYYFDWLQHTDRSSRGYPTVFPKWPMEPRAVRTYAEEHPFEHDGNSAGRYQELWNEQQTKALETAYGEPVEASPLLSSFDRGFDCVWRPFASFPHAWIAVEMFAGSLLRPHFGIDPEAQKKTLRGGEQWPADVEAMTQAYRDARAEAERWIERARRAGLYTAVPEPDRMAFWAWLDGLDASATDRIYDRRSAYTLNSCLNTAAALSVDYCLAHSAVAAALVPDEAVEAV